MPITVRCGGRRLVRRADQRGAPRRFQSSFHAPRAAKTRPCAARLIRRREPSRLSCRARPSTVPAQAHRSRARPVPPPASASSSFAGVFWRSRSALLAAARTAACHRGGTVVVRADDAGGLASAAPLPSGLALEARCAAVGGRGRACPRPVRPRRRVVDVVGQAPGTGVP